MTPLVEHDAPEPEAPPGQVRTAASTGNRRATLIAMRDRLAHAIDFAYDEKALPGMIKELRAVLVDLDSLPGGDEQDDVDDLAAARATRLAGAAGGQLPGVRPQRRP